MAQVQSDKRVGKTVLDVEVSYWLTSSHTSLSEAQLHDRSTLKARVRQAIF